MVGCMSPTGVTDLAQARAHRYARARIRRRGEAGRQLVQLKREPLTAIVQVSNIRADAEVHRHIGINDAMTFAELHRVLEVCFDLPSEDAPWHFYEHDSAGGARGARIDPQRQVSEFLWCEGTQVDYSWGLWDFSLVVAELYPRDGGTPQALCVGGSGSFAGSHFDLTAINAALTGQETIDEVLTQVAAPVRAIIERSKLYDFVPLLKALDLTRPAELSDAARAVITSLPREVTNEGKDAFWATALALACMSGAELTDTVIATVMDALGWVDDDGNTLDGAAARKLCAASLDQLAGIGGYGFGAAAPVDRLDIYRALLAR